jgi:hypothetical protein
MRAFRFSSLLFIVASTVAAQAQPKALPAPVFASAVAAARQYAEDRTLLNYCFRTDDEATAFLALGLHDDLQTLRLVLQGADANVLQMAELVRAVLSNVRYAAPDAKDPRLDGDCRRKDVGNSYADMKPNSVATPLFLRPPFDKMRPK